jgi:hypothetical protein
MSTPASGTVQAFLDVEPSKPKRRLVSIRFKNPTPFNEYFKLPKDVQNVLLAIAAAPASLILSALFLVAMIGGAHVLYIVTVGWIGRSTLDDYHWRYTIPEELMVIDSHGEMVLPPGDDITGVLAGFLALPGCWLIWLAGEKVRDQYPRDEFSIKFLMGCAMIINGLASVGAAGAAMHRRFHYINAISMMGIFGTGTLVAFAGLIGVFLLLVFLGWLSQSKPDPPVNV